MPNKLGVDWWMYLLREWMKEKHLQCQRVGSLVTGLCLVLIWQEKKDAIAKEKEGKQIQKSMYTCKWLDRKFKFTAPEVQMESSKKKKKTEALKERESERVDRSLDQKSSSFCLEKKSGKARKARRSECSQKAICRRQTRRDRKRKY